MNSLPFSIQYALAARNGNINRVKWFLKYGKVNVNTRHDPDQTALALAASRGHNHVVKYLISKGAFINSRDYLGITPLMRATISGKENVVRTLLDAGANINARSDSGKTALGYAALWNRGNIARILIQRGARTNFKNSNGKTAANLAKTNKLKRNISIPKSVLRFLARRETGR